MSFQFLAGSLALISQDKLKLAPIPLAPLLEQKKIIETVDQLILLCDQFKNKLNTAQSIQLQLTDAITEAAIN